MRKTISFAVWLLSLLFALSCTREEGTGEGKLAAPEIKLAALGPTSFSIKWARVEGAAKYAYEFAGATATTDTTVLTLDGLVENTEYTLALTAIPREGASRAASEPAYIQVVTARVEPLSSPVITLGCAYASKTIINWSSVPGADGYSYTLASPSDTTRRGTTQGTRQEWSNLRPGCGYTFTVTALSADATLSSNSVEASLAFDTEDGDIPVLILSPAEAGSDYVAFEVFTMPEVTYFQYVAPATFQEGKSEEEILDMYSTIAVKAAQNYSDERHVSFPLAMAYFLKSGSQSFKESGENGLFSELSYDVIVFGMDLQGKRTTGLYTERVKTTRKEHSDGPHFGSCDWFSQEVYLDEEASADAGVDPADGVRFDLTNSFWTRWKGVGVTSVRYRTIPTEVFRRAFPMLDEGHPTPEEESHIRLFLNTPGYSYEVKESDVYLLSLINDSEDGYKRLTRGDVGTSYTEAALAQNTDGEEALLVNSVTTLNKAERGPWFVTGLAVDTTGEYNPASKILAYFEGLVDIARVRYRLCKTEEIADVPVSDYSLLVQDQGVDITNPTWVGNIGHGGLRVACDAEPSTSYTLMATAVNSVGDTLTSYAVGSTTALSGVQLGVGREVFRSDKAVFERWEIE